MGSSKKKNEVSTQHTQKSNIALVEYQLKHNQNIMNASVNHSSNTVVELSKKQTQIYEYLINKGLSGKFTYRSLADKVGIKETTVISAVKKLKERKVITTNYSLVSKQQSYVFLTETKVEKYELEDDRNLMKTQPSYISSSSFSKENTTKCSKTDLSDPELLYWQENGLSGIQINNWVKEFNISTDTIILRLKYARFDLVVNEKEKNLNKNSPINWFHGSLRKGSYGKPSNYKSYSEIQIIEEEKIANKIKTDMENLKKIRIKKENYKLDLALEEMLANPESELYNKCLKSTSPGRRPFFRHKKNQKGINFTQEMRKSLEKMLNENNQ